MLPSTLLALHSVPDKHHPDTKQPLLLFISLHLFPRRHTHMALQYHIDCIRDVVKSVRMMMNEQQKREGSACFLFAPHSWVLWVNMCLITASCVLITEERRRMEVLETGRDYRTDHSHYCIILKAGAGGALNYSLWVSGLLSAHKQTLYHVN